MSAVEGECGTRVAYPVERLFEVNPVNRPEAFFDCLFGKAQPSERTVSDSKPT